MTLKIYWYETGVLSTAKSAASKAASAATKTASTAQRSASNQAQSQARQGDGKSAEQNKLEFQQAQTTQKQTGRAISITLGENLKFSEGAAIERKTQTGSKEGGLTAVKTSRYEYDDEGEIVGVKQNQSSESQRYAAIKPAEKPSEKSTSNFAYDQYGEATIKFGELSNTVTNTQYAQTSKLIIPREERQKVKDYLTANKSLDGKPTLYNIYNEQGKVIARTSGRNAYPDIIKYSLTGKYSIGVARGTVTSNLKPVVFPSGIVYFQDQAYPETKPKGYGIKEYPTVINQPQPPLTKQYGRAFAQPVTNLISVAKTIVIPQGANIPLGQKGEAFVLTPPKEYVNTPLDNLFKTGEELATPTLRATGSTLFPSIVKPASKEELQQVKPIQGTGIPKTVYDFGANLGSQLMKNPIPTLLQTAGEAGVLLTPFGLQTKISGYLAKKAGTKAIATTVKDIRGIFTKEETKLTLEAGLKSSIPVIDKAELMTVYHGTSVTSAMAILKQGFKNKVGKVKLPNPTDNIYGSTDKNLAKTYGNFRTTTEGQTVKDSTTILEITGKKSDFTVISEGQKGANTIYTIPSEDILGVKVVEGRSYLKGQTYYPKGISLGKDIAGGTIKKPVKTKVTLAGYSASGQPITRIEAETNKQKALALYNPKTKEFLAVSEWESGYVPKKVNVLGSLSDVTQKPSLQKFQQEYFGLTSVGKDLFTSASKATPTKLQEAFLKRKGLNLAGQTGNVKETLLQAAEKGGGKVEKTGLGQVFTLKEAKKSPRAFGEYIFGGGEQMTKPKTSIGMLETIGRYGGTTVGKETASKGKVVLGVRETIETSSKSLSGKFQKITGQIAKWKPLGRENIGGVYEAFKKGTKGKLVFTEKEKHIFEISHKERAVTLKKTPIPKYSFTSDLQKLGETFEKKGTASTYGKVYDLSKTGATVEGIGKYSDGTAKKPEPILTLSREQRTEAVEKLKRPDVEILFSKPRFTEQYAGYGAITELTSHKLGDKMVTPEPISISEQLRMVESPQQGKFKTKDLQNTMKILNVNVKSSIKQNQPSLFKVITGIATKPSLASTPITKTITTPITSIIQTIIPKTTPIITPRITTKTTPISILKTPEILVPQPKPIIPEKPLIPLTPIVPTGFWSLTDQDVPSRDLGERKGFFGNVPIESIEGIYGKKPDITYSEGSGFHALTKRGFVKKTKKQTYGEGLTKRSYSYDLGKPTLRIVGGKKQINKYGGGLLSTKSGSLKIFGGKNNLRSRKANSYRLI